MWKTGIDPEISKNTVCIKMWKKFGIKAAIKRDIVYNSVEDVNVCGNVYIL